ncbi:MAG: hypothetical protein ISS81_10070 [Candidatus Marinimicrobia bacterium]|nr:hypothetical protein [Candidatus Neomarinimicrobiota bacterium]
MKANIKRWWKALVVVILINTLSLTSATWIAGFFTGILFWWGVWCLEMMWHIKNAG